MAKEYGRGAAMGAPRLAATAVAHGATLRRVHRGQLRSMMRWFLVRPRGMRVGR